MAEGSRLAIDRGEKPLPKEIPGGRCFEDAIRNSGLPSVDVFHSDYDSIDENCLVILRSNTVIPERINSQNRLTYPPVEALIKISDKLKFYRWCTKRDILSPPTRLLPEHYIQTHPDSPLHPNFEKTFILKPRIPLGRARIMLQQVYNKPHETWPIIVEGIKKVEDDLVIQKRLDGKVVKVFGVYPDLFYSYSYDVKDHEQQKITKMTDKTILERCHPNIANKCRFLFSELGLRWGGVDFIQSSDGLLYLIDINPTTGGRPIPESDHVVFQKRMNGHLQELINRKPLTTTSSDIKIFITAAGKNSRLRNIIGETPKALVLLDEHDTVIDKLLNMIQPLNADAGFDPKLRILHQASNSQAFNTWLHKRIEKSTQLIEPVSDWLQVHTPANDLMSASSDTDTVLTFPCDRLIDIPQKEIERIKKEIQKAFYFDDYSFIVLGVADQEGRYGYDIDQNGKIVGLSKWKNQLYKNSESKTINVHCRKWGIAYKSSKLPFIEATTTQDMINKMIQTGMNGKLLLLQDVAWYGDLDTPEDLEIFMRHFSRIRV